LCLATGPRPNRHIVGTIVRHLARGDSSKNISGIAFCTFNSIGLGAFPKVIGLGTYPVVIRLGDFPLVIGLGAFPIVIGLGAFPIGIRLGDFPLSIRLGAFPLIKSPDCEPSV
jgi:hypothetical protein